jgi:hypothetical protein
MVKHNFVYLTATCFGQGSTIIRSANIIFKRRQKYSVQGAAEKPDGFQSERTQ